MKKPSAQSGGLFIVDIPQKHIIILAMRANRHRGFHTKKPAPKRPALFFTKLKAPQVLEYMVVSFSVLGM